MPIKTIIVPGMGGILKVTIVDMPVAPGDYVQSDEVVLVLETDKFSIDVRATEGGALVEVLGEIDDVVEVGSNLYRIDTDADPPESASDLMPEKEETLTPMAGAFEEFKANVNLRPYFENSYGYAVFESIKTTEENRFVKKGAWVVNGAYGEGAVYINTSKTVDGTADNVQTGTSNMIQASKGQHVGLKTPYPMIIFFQTQQDYAKFATIGKDTFEFGDDKYVLTVPTSFVPGMPRIGLYAKGMVVFTPDQEVGRKDHRFAGKFGKLLFVESKFPITGQQYSFIQMGN